MTNLTKKKCVPCEGGVPPLKRAEAEELLKELNDWALIDDAHLLAKSFRFKNFVTTMEFVNEVAAIAEEEGHHPTLVTEWGKVTVVWWSHRIRGVHRNDFIMAAKTNQVYLMQTRQITS